MAQFDVYTNPNDETNDRIPYLLDIQHDILNDLSTRMVIPLITTTKPIQHLTPSFEVEGETVYLMTSEMAGVPLRVLGKRVISLEQARQEIIHAVDFLITGF